MSQKGSADMTANSEEARDVLREVWKGQGQDASTLEGGFRPPKVCKNMVNVGFDAMAGEDGDLRSAWRATLQREGKYNASGQGVRDLVLGQQGSD
jgi:hypothetical protein